MKRYTHKIGLISLILFFLGKVLSAQTVTTDLPDYPPGDTVFITGTGWLPGEIVTLQVIHHGVDGDNDTSTAHQPFYTTAYTDGNISSYWVVPPDEDELGATLLLTADGQTSGLHAETIFTDALKTDTYPLSFLAFSGGGSFCQNASAPNLSASWSITTCNGASNGSNTNIPITITWFKKSDSIPSGGTPVQTTNTNAGTTSTTFPPPTNIVGTLFYYVVVSWGSGSNCAPASSITTSVSKKVIVNTIPAAVTGGAKTICSGSGTTLGAASVSGNSYLWSPAAGLSSTSISNPTASPTVNTTYTLVETTTATGCTKSNTAVVTVNSAPVLSLSSTNINKSAAHGACSASVTYNIASATGTPAPSIVYSPVSGSSFPVGQTTVTATATNSCGSDSKTFTVTVTDDEKPLATPPPNITQNTDAGQCYATVNLGTPVTSDNCGIQSVTNNAPATFPVGVTTVTWTVTDLSGNTKTPAQTVTISDHENPNAITKNITVQLNASGSASIIAADIDNGSNDACGIKSLSASKTSFNCADIGPNTVILTVTDNHDNVSTANATVTVSDTLAPIITCPANKTVNCDASLLPADNGTATATDNCDSNPTISSSDVSTQDANIANNAHYNYTITRTWKAMDVTGNFKTCNQIITIQDTTKPVITCPAAITINCDASQLPANTGSATATDNCDASPVISSSDVSTQNANASNAAHYNYTITRTWKAMDVSGNFKTCNQIITIQDTTKPVITCPIAITINCDASQLPANTGSANATDNCDNNPGITSSDVSTQNADATVAGHYNYSITRTWKAMDVAGNFKTCDQIITVRDTTKPVVSCPSNKTINCDASSSPAYTGIGSATDNCDDDPAITSSDVSTQNANASNAAHYNYTITRTWKAMDVIGNFSTCNQIITVQDTTSPVITCPVADSTYRYVDPYSVTYTVQGTELNATALDNCSPVTFNYSLTGATTGTGISLAGVVLNNGKTTVEWRATDASGNSEECYFYIKVGTRPTTLTINQPTPSVTSAQYSDSIPLRAELVDYANLKVNNKPIVFQVGTQVFAAVNTDINGLAKTKIKLNQNPNASSNDKVKATFAGDGSYTGSSDCDVFDVTREDACGVYNGVLFANTASESGGSATVRLKVFVTEANDGSLGDVRLATVAFTVLDGATVILNAGAATLDPGSTSTQATFYKDVTVSLSSTVLSKTLDVSWAIGGYYTDANCTEKTTEVTVSAPAPDFVTGGGFEILQNSGGSYAGDAGSKNNFGFSAKWNKNLTNIQAGGINTIVRKNGHQYQVKGNKVTYLNVIPKTSTAPAKAVFYCNAVIKDVTDPLNVSTMEGNATAVIEITDVSEPGGSGINGTPDSIAITVRDKNGALWFSNKWNGVKSLKQALTGGNIQIRTAVSRSMEATSDTADETTDEAATTTGISDITKDGPYAIKVFPNPSDNTKITVSITGYEDGNSPVKLYIFDITGKMTYSDEKFCLHNCNETVLDINGKYSPGTYLIDIVIEDKTYHQKLIIQ